VLNHRARSGLFVLVQRWRCADGTVLNRDMQGRTRGWRISALGGLLAGGLKIVQVL
jgi:hypothetical protein